MQKPSRELQSQLCDAHIPLHDAPLIGQLVGHSTRIEPGPPAKAMRPTPKPSARPRTASMRTPPKRVDCFFRVFIIVILHVDQYGKHERRLDGRSDEIARTYSHFAWRTATRCIRRVRLLSFSMNTTTISSTPACVVIASVDPDSPT